MEGGELKMQIKMQIKRIAAVAATSAMLLSTFATTAFASTELVISGNGASSDNTTSVTTTHTNTVVQSNDATVHNDVNSNASTGGNTANDNTGGDTTVVTGNARSTTDVSNAVNLNKADVNNCNCPGGDTSVTISGNGASSRSDANLSQNSDTAVFQDNNAHVTNNVDATAKTGYNDANRNTGGDTTIYTGNAVTEVGVSTKANANVAQVGGNGAGSGSSSVNALITGNGAYSHNSVDLVKDHSITLVQDNYADVRNDVDAKAKTGNNKASDNTGGGTTIDTGMAATYVDVDTMANFNAAEVGCDCLVDTLAKVHGNGYDSDNNLRASLGDDLSVFQGGQEGAGNSAYLDNYVDGNAGSGYNDAKRNTASGDPSDPLILTGHSVSETGVSNKANVNVYGDGAHLSLPGGTVLDFDFSLGSIWNLMH